MTSNVIGPGWLRKMSSQALRPDVGTVGAKLLCPNEQIQHAGLTMDRRGLASTYIVIPTGMRRVTAVNWRCRESANRFQ